MEHLVYLAIGLIALIALSAPTPDEREGRIKKPVAIGMLVTLGTCFLAPAYVIGKCGWSRCKAFQIILPVNQTAPHCRAKSIARSRRKHADSGQ